ncbi:MAG TPA: MlaE family ABC transporter permease [Candidatus Hypogeohydataceae bacterium YC38]|nr:ABC transporter permease [Candidatus Brocadiales bacterium]
MGRFFTALGEKLLSFFQSVGEMLQLLAATILWCRVVFKSLDKVLPQMGKIGADTLPIATLTAVFVGFVLALQTGIALKQFGQEENIGAVVSLSMARELGPVLTAILVIGRIGAAITAEIATMSVSEEIDALKTLGINPVRFLVMPRFLACITMLPVLVIYVDIIGMVGGAAVSKAYFGVPIGVYADNVADYLEFEDIAKGLVKSVVFGVIIAIVSCHRGLVTVGGPGEVGQATTNSVVFSFVSVYVSNYFVTRLWLE